MTPRSSVAVPVRVTVGPATSAPEAGAVTLTTGDAVSGVAEVTVKLRQGLSDQLRAASRAITSNP